ncbi:hypothetical protein ACIBK9_28315 [Nonomuraea sp. NPDC050227]|uniref:hypothetical protein n=1 Tax=Nonomuraea sp. NPDC050227 TaxID=3364360 RepID=UPI00378F8C1A
MRPVARELSRARTVIGGVGRPAVATDALVRVAAIAGAALARTRPFPTTRPGTSRVEQSAGMDSA